MKKIYFLFLMIICACSRTPKNNDHKNSKDPGSKNAIEQTGRSFYDWYFKNHFQDINVVKAKDGKCMIDTLSYFNKLRSLKTISEKFITNEKNRLNGCNLYLATVDYSDYEKSEAYDYADYCEMLYYMYWIQSQEEPGSFSVRDVKLLSENQASLDIYLNYEGEGEPLSRVKMEKEQGSWKIVKIDFIKRGQITAKQKAVNGKWQNAFVTLNIGDNSLAFEYHGQCVYFYPLKKISNTEFQMIWAKDMDCKFDNGTSKTFGLNKVPEIGKPFVRFTLKDDILFADYYYKEWVEAYTEQVARDVFTKNYFRKNEVN